jgi:multicomponent Na+:H+ antiporter subunit B
MKSTNLLKIVCSIILPFTLLLGFYVIFNGDISPGGGFQGGVLLSTSLLLMYFIKEDHLMHFKEIIKIEKHLFLSLLLIGIVYLLNNYFFLPSVYNIYFLILLNFLIGIKVTVGLSGIFLIFLEESNQ